MAVADAVSAIDLVPQTLVPAPSASTPVRPLLAISYRGCNEYLPIRRLFHL
jgi:hypothetical protein